MHACVDDTGSEGLPVVVSGNFPATAGKADLPHKFVDVELKWLCCLLLACFETLIHISAGGTSGTLWQLQSLQDGKP
jgi:hypothetical protein